MLCMHYEYISSSCGQKSMCKMTSRIINEIDRCKISEWEVVLGAPDKVKIPCLMHDTHLCLFDVGWLVGKEIKSPPDVLVVFLTASEV